jgi:hypothetical protein
MDAVVNRTWREIDDYQPRPGDLAIFKRDGKDPTRGEEGHVERVEERRGILVTSIGGNVGDAVVRRMWSIEHDDGPDALVGWIVRAQGLTDEEREMIEANVQASTQRFIRASLGS